MTKNTVRARLLASSMITGAAFLFGNAAYAANAAATNPEAELVVTGSRIPSPNLTSTSPIAIVNSTEIKSQGTIAVETLINSLPQAYAGQTNAVANGATGTATVNLRGLGSVRTLVLIDGTRLMPADAASPVADLNNIPAALVDRVEVLTGGASAVYGSDALGGVVNFIMKKDFEGLRIDAQYGFATHHNDNGPVRAALQQFQDDIAEYNAQPTTVNPATGHYSTTRHPTANRDPNNWAIPSDNYTDGRTYDITLVLGVNAPDGKGNATVYAGYRNIQPVLEATRDWSACSVGPSTLLAQNPGTTTDWACAGSSNAYYGRIFDRNLRKADGVTFNNGDGTGVTGFGKGFTTFTNGQLAPYSYRSAFNFAPTNYIQRPDERYVAGAFAHYQFNPMAEVYTSFMFADDHTVAQIAPSALFGGSGVFGGNWTVNCSNPFLGSAADPNSPFSILCAASGRGVNDSTTLEVRRRATDLGPRQDDLRHTSYRVVWGLRGDLGDAWRYDAYAQLGRTIYSEHYLHDLSAIKIQNALNVVNVNGVPTCTSVINHSDPNCVPLNVFTQGAASLDGWHYVETPGFKEAETTEWVVSGSLTGDLGQYGFKSPWASDGVGIAVGAEYRQEQLDFNPDGEFATGDLTGQGGPQPPVHGRYQVKEIFGEARFPIVQDAPFAKILQFEAGYRYSNYSNAGGTNTYKFGGDWAVTDDIRFRASYQRAVRAPNIVELFTPQAVGLFGGADGCASNTGIPTTSSKFAGCLASFNTVDTATATTIITSGIPACPASQCSALFSGNPDLKPESSDTYSVGFVFTPTFFKGFSLTVDYFDIKIDGLIGPIAPFVSLAECQGFGSGDPLANPNFCSTVHRDPSSGAIFGNQGYIHAETTNTGGLKTAGVDVSAIYRADLEDWGVHNAGSLTFALDGTYTSKYTTDFADGLLDVPAIDCVGQFGIYCGAPVPKWRHTFRLTWHAPWKFDISARWRYVHSTKSEFVRPASELQPFVAFLNTYFEGCTSSDSCSVYDQLDTKIKAYNYFDLSGTWHVKDGIAIRGGINNIFDKDPPVVDAGGWGITLNANTFVGSYDTLGRTVFIGITADF